MAEKRKNGIRIYEPAEFEGMRKAGQVAAECLDYITPYVKVGVSTGELDDLCREFMIAKGAIPACLGYHGYPKSVCISINHVICHGIPSYERKLADGDILNIDVTAIVEESQDISPEEIEDALNEKVCCLHCGAEYPYRETKIIVDEFGDEFTVCKNFPECDGHDVDLMPAGYENM